MKRRVAALAVVLVTGGFPIAGQTPLGAQFRVNTSTAEIDWVSAASNGSGPFVIVWTNYAYNLGRTAGQRYDANGAPLGGEFFVIDQPQIQYAQTVKQQSAPAAAVNASGDFVVVWSGRMLLQSAYQVQIVGRRFSGSGAPIGAEFRIDTALTADSARPRVAFDGNGGFVVVWEQRPEPYVAYRRYDASGSPLGPPSNIADFARTTDVAPLRDGSFLVPWADTLTPGNIWAERFDSTGSPLGGRFLVDSSASTGLFAGPRVAVDPSGAFAVVWPSSDLHTMMSRYDASGTPLGGKFAVDLDGEYRDFVGVAADSDGRYLVTWQSLVPGIYESHIRARLLSGGEIRTSAGTSPNHFVPATAAIGRGQFVVVWMDDFMVDAMRVTTPIRGDVNGDRTRNVSDVFYLINFLFAGGPAPVG